MKWKGRTPPPGPSAIPTLAMCISRLDPFRSQLEEMSSHSRLGRKVQDEMCNHMKKTLANSIYTVRRS